MPYIFLSLPFSTSIVARIALFAYQVRIVLCQCIFPILNYYFEFEFVCRLGSLPLGPLLFLFCCCCFWFFLFGGGGVTTPAFKKKEAIIHVCMIILAAFKSTFIAFVNSCAHDLNLYNAYFYHVTYLKKKTEEKIPEMFIYQRKF